MVYNCVYYCDTHTHTYVVVVRAAQQPPFVQRAPERCICVCICVCMYVYVCVCVCVYVCMSYGVEKIGVVSVYMVYMVYNCVYYCDTCYI
jgi:hypothetical protein